MSRFAGVRARLLVVVVAAVAPIVVLLVVQAADARDDTAAVVRAEALRIARLLADDERHRAEDAEGVLRSLAAAADDAGFAGTCTALPGVLEARRGFEALAMVRLSDDLACGIGISVPGDLEPGEVRVRYRHGPDPRQEVVLREGDVALATALAVDLDRALDRTDLGPGGAITLLDGEGRVYARAPDVGGFVGAQAAGPLADALVSDDGTLEVDGLDGVRRLYGYARVPGVASATFLTVGTPADEAYADAEGDLRRSLAGAGATALLAVVFTLVLAELTVARPLRRIAGVARRLEGGELDARTGLGGGDEVGDVGAALDDLAATVAASQEQLARAAREREALLRELVGAHDQERRRLAEDIHDETIQALTAAGIRVQRLRRQVGSEELATVAEEAEQAVGRAIGDLRTLMVSLVPDDTGEGMAPLLRRFLEAELGPIGVEWDLDVDLGAEPAPEVQSLVVRNVREAVRNAALHAAAGRVEVRVGATAGLVEATVRDDGRGFDPDEAVDPGHLGLRSLRQRTERVGGWCRITSAPGQGTAVAFAVPAG